MSDKYAQSDKAALVNAIGTECGWGWSPPVDLCELLDVVRGRAPIPPKPTLPGDVKASNPSDGKVEEIPDDDDDTAAAAAAKLAAAAEGDQPKEDVNILLVGSADVRHVLETLCKVRRKKHVGKVNFYFYEPNLRVHCRHIFFLNLLLELATLRELEDRTAIFLELFGNVMVRDTSATLMKRVAKQAARLIGFEEGVLSSIVSFDHMKDRERDFVEEQLKWWASDKAQFQVEQQWDARVRTDMAERYDNRVNVVDWDFNFALAEYVPILKFPEYREWRIAGQAFDYARINPRKGFSYDYTCPNKTLGFFDKRKGVAVYQGDVKNGPFYALGACTENPHLLRRGVDGQVKYGNGTVAMHNVRAWLYELLTQQQWPWADHSFAWDDAAAYNQLPPGAPQDTELTPALPPCSFHFVELDLDRFLLRTGPEAKGDDALKFDAAFVGCSAATCMRKPFWSAMKPDGVVVTETVKFVVDAKDEAKAAYVRKMRDMAAEFGWKESGKGAEALHTKQPEPRLSETAASQQQEKAQQRLRSPHQLCFVK